MRLRWKVCGITRIDDALAAVEAGADALGFVFWPGSPRCITERQAASIIDELPSETWRIGVFVDESPKTLDRIADSVGLDFIQLSGDENPTQCCGLVRHAIKALRLGPESTPADTDSLAAKYPECTLLVDAGVPGEYGGTGKTCKWEVAAYLARQQRVMLAGGLTPENVDVAIETVGPWAVDVSSGVEISPGLKDPRRLAEFGAAIEPYRWQ